MKKFLLCMLLAGLMMPVVAQEKVAFEKKSIYANEIKADLGLSDAGMLPMNPKGALVDVDGWTYAGTSNGYDRQTQGCVYPMTKTHDDGFIGATWTNEDNPPFEGSLYKTRGVGYAYSRDGGNTWEGLTLRVGGIVLYWPSYAQWGKNGEAILARSADTHEYQGVQILNGLVLLTRENKGTGDWKLTPIPYPEGTPSENGWVMAWSRMITSGDNHQYIHIMTHTRWGTTCDPNHYYEGYCEPVFYYRTSDGGETWDHAGVLIPEAAGIEWDKDPNDPSYTDQISMAQHGNVIAVSFIRYGYHSYVLKSVDNGDTWNAINFYYSSIYSGDPEQYADTCFIPTQGCVGVDNNGKVHVAFGTRMIDNEYRYSGYFSSFLSYWNEDMDLLDVANFIKRDMDDLIWDEFIDEDLTQSLTKLYIKSTTPKWPIIGFYVPTVDEYIFSAPELADFEWIQEGYGLAGTFSFPQMTFDADNTLHLTYLGILDDGSDDGRWIRHPYYTTRNEDGIWTETEYLVNSVDLIDREFAYLTLSGLYDDKMFLMAQVDQSAGTHTAYSGGTADHGETTNYYYFFNVSPVPTPVAINEIDYTPLTLNVYPNPTSGHVNVNFEGKGNITIYNMLGQTVYHVENVENQKDIPLNNMATGVYFVTVRSGNAMATQKLIVK